MFSMASVGKFMMQVLPPCGHAVHEDIPDKVRVYIISTLLLCLWSLIFFQEIDTFAQQGCIKLIKSDSKDFYKATKISILNAVLLNFLFICES